MATRQAKRRFAEELPRLLAEKGWSQRKLAAQVGVNQSHISRVARGADHQTRPSLDLVARIAVALDLPEDYFIEYREGVIIERMRHDPTFREETYARLTEARNRPPRSRSK